MNPEKKPVRAPYNFVPFHTAGGSGTQAPVEKILLRYRDAAQLPSHGVIDPALKTGEIHVTLCAQTPVFVSDGHKREVSDPSGKIREIDDPHFFRGANGAFMLPGSTIRGMVRENMQILGFASVRAGEDLEDYQIYFRNMADAKNSTGDPLKKYYRDAVGTESFKAKNNRYYSIPRNVKAGYLRKRGGAYYIQPVKGSYIRIPRGDPVLREANLANGTATTVNVVYTAANGRVSSIRRGDRPVPGMEQGVLLYTGPGIGKRLNARYLFPAADREKEAIPISEEDRISYQEDFENRRNKLGENRDFWALPENGKEKPVFYIRHDGHVYFGMSLFLRIGYRHKLSDGLPGRQAQQEGSVPLDYTHAILGFTGDENSYRSRVSFGDFAALGDPREGGDIRMVLMQPKPSWYPGYVAEGKNYNEDGFRLRGYKLYWLKKEANIPPIPAERASMSSLLRPLPAGTEFRGVIRYKNLHPDELGLLLWALRLDDGCFQSVGMGKPYGLGRMKLSVDSLTEYDTLAMYRADSLCRLPTVEGRDSVAGYIRAFDEYICAGLGIEGSGGEPPSIRNEAVIRDFFFIRSKLLTQAQAGYMELDEYRNLKNSLPGIGEIREKLEKTPAGPGDINQREETGS